MKNTLRYLLILVAIMGVLSVNATAPQYGKTYQPQYDQEQYTPSSAYTQMPSVNMQSTSALQGSGSALPQAAVTGSLTAEEAQTAVQKSGPRKERPEHWTDPYVPIGDAAIPLMLLACAYFIMRVVRKRTRALNR